MKNNGVSRGFGFVCFKAKDQAQLAIDQLKDFVFHNKPLYVGLAQTRNERFLQRKMFINAIFQPRFNNFATRQVINYKAIIYIHCVFIFQASVKIVYLQLCKETVLNKNQSTLVYN